MAVPVRIGSEVYEQIEGLAKAEQRSVTKMTGILLAEALASRQKPVPRISAELTEREHALPPGETSGSAGAREKAGMTPPVPAGSRSVSSGHFRPDPKRQKKR